MSYKKAFARFLLWVKVSTSRVEYSLTEKRKSVVPILQSFCKWSGIFFKEDSENTMIQCKKCDYR